MGELKVLKYIRNIFIFYRMLSDWLLCRCKPLNLHRIGNVDLFVFVIGMLLYKITNNMVIMQKYMYFFLGFLFLQMPFAVLKFDIVCLPRKWTNGSITLEQLFSNFKTISYIYGIVVFNLCSSFYIYFSVSCFTVVFNGKLAIPPIRTFLILIYIISAIFTFFWFAYHIVFNTVSTMEIKMNISLYLSFCTTLSAGIISTFKDTLKPILIATGIAFAWINSLIIIKDTSDKIYNNETISTEKNKENIEVM